jgi:DNA integrity scanning protein DisA with diadenylate cyclase activity
MDTISFIGNLAGADGAIVITQSLTVIGFSAEINIQGQMAARVFAVADPMKKQKTKLDVEQFGMRHRSAIKLCSTTEDAIVFVVSQDGDVSLVWREKAGVMVKKGVNTTNANMVLT